MKEEYEIKWWGDWLEADTIKRKEMVEKLPIINEILNFGKIPLEIRKQTFVSILIENSGNYILFCPEFSKGQFGEGSNTNHKALAFTPP